MAAGTITRVVRVRWHWLFYALYAVGLNRLGFSLCVKFEDTQ